jgi:hypothetical protein
MNDIYLNDELEYTPADKVYSVPRIRNVTNSFLNPLSTSKTSGFLFILLLFCVILLLYCCGVWRPEQMTQRTQNLTDERLAELVEDAVGKKTAPENVAAVVGIPPKYKTFRLGGEVIFRGVLIEDDTAEEACLPILRNVTDVVFWIRPIRSENPRVIGIAWGKDGSCRLFRGVLFPRF